MHRFSIPASPCAAALVLLLVNPTGSWARERRIAIGGSWGTGYVGLFARHGLPRERLLDPQLADPDILRRYSLVIVAGTVTNWDTAEKAIAAYVNQGGNALLECTAMPSTDTIPGTRITAQAAPNVVVEGNHPATAGLAAGTQFTHNGYTAAAIVPDGATGTMVLARFTDEGAPNEVKGRFVANGQGAPAIIYKPLGKGHLIYSGPWMAHGLALGRDYSQLVFALVRFLTGGDVVPRLTLAGPENLMIGRAWGPPVDAAGVSPAEVSLPDGYQLVENLTDFEEYDLQGAIDGPVAVLTDYLGPDTGYRITLDGGGPPSIGAAKAPDAVTGTAKIAGGGIGHELIVARRYGSIRMLVDGRTVVEMADGGRSGGAVACRGLTEPILQPVEPVRFADDFMREAGQAGTWQPVSGRWEVISSEGSPATGANPFSYGVQTGDAALVRTGEWYWDDYELGASARWTQNVAGLAFNYRDPENHDLVEADIDAQELRHVEVRQGERVVGASASAELRPWQWYRLGVQASRGLVVISLDGRPLIETRDGLGGAGGIGLYARSAKAAFDDVEADHWLAAFEAHNWRVPDGDGRHQSAPEEPVVVNGPLQAPERWGDVEVRARLRLGKAEAAGVRLRDTGDEACTVSLAREGGKAELRLAHTGKGRDATVLGSAPVPDVKPTKAAELLVKVVGDRVFCSVDGNAMLMRSLALPANGFVGVFSEGNHAAALEGIDIRPAQGDIHPCDPPTPEYAGAVDVMTWAGPAFSWLPDPGDLSLFWHEGDAPGTMRLKLGVHKGEEAGTVAHAYLTPSGVADGYTARFEHTWGDGTVSATIERGGQALVQGSYRGDVGDGFLVCVERAAGSLALAVNGTTVATHNDPDPPDCRRVGVRLEGSTLCYDDLSLERSHVRTYTFSEAPADWLVQNGTWEVQSRWTCNPGWTWLGGLDARFALVQSKWRVEGDLAMDTYVGAKMMNTPSGRKEVLQDIRIGVCGEPGYLNAGYFFLIGAKGGQWTALQRNGLVVAETSSFTVPKGSVHNDWLRLGVEKRGGRIALLCQGQPVLSYDDPEPLTGGTVSIGTYDNGILIPRVTVHGDIRE